MLIAQNLAIYFLVSQGLASLLLVLAAVLDAETFERIESRTHVAIPGLSKIVQLFRATEKNWMMGIYFLSLVLVVLSYAGIVLLVAHLIGLTTGIYNSI
jgi:hypothetical protein